MKQRRLKDHVISRNCTSIDELQREIDRYIKDYNNHRYQWGLKKDDPCAVQKSSFINCLTVFFFSILDKGISSLNPLSFQNVIYELFFYKESDSYFSRIFSVNHICIVGSVESSEPAIFLNVTFRISEELDLYTTTRSLL